MPIYIYKCTNDSCSVVLFDEYSKIAKNSFKTSICIKCGHIAKRTYHKQTMCQRKGKITSFRKGGAVWEDIDALPDNKTFDTSIKGKIIDESELEIS